MTEASYLNKTRESYDTVAANYAALLASELDGKPWDRAMLAAFAEIVESPVADLGYGPGRVTGHLHALGVDAFGIDLSPAMVEVARRTYPHLHFEVGTMTALTLADASVGGVLAWYSTVHTPPELLPVVFGEFHRVLRPGGHLLIAFKAGDERRHLAKAYGHELSLEVYWLPPERVAEMLTDAGFVVDVRLVREPDSTEKGPQGFILARRPVE